MNIVCDSISDSLICSLQICLMTLFNFLVFQVLMSHPYVFPIDAPLVSNVTPLHSPFCFYIQVANYKDPRDACAAIVAESYRLWLQYETRTDDITVIVVHINGLTGVR